MCVHARLDVSRAHLKKKKKRVRRVIAVGYPRRRQYSLIIIIITTIKRPFDRILSYNSEQVLVGSEFRRILSFVFFTSENFQIQMIRRDSIVSNTDYLFEYNNLRATVTLLCIKYDLFRVYTASVKKKKKMTENPTPLWIIYNIQRIPADCKRRILLYFQKLYFECVYIYIFFIVSAQSIGNKKQVIKVKEKQILIKTMFYVMSV